MAVDRSAVASAGESLLFASEARAESYDVIVIGGGIGGLSPAAFLAQSGRRVLVLEQGEGPADGLGAPFVVAGHRRPVDPQGRAGTGSLTRPCRRRPRSR